MALIHENLFKIDNLTIDPEAYFDMLIQNVNNAYQLKNIQTTVSINHSRIMDLDTAIPLGLILNELVTNSFKYAFEENRQNKLNIALVSHKNYNELSVSDNGPGFAEEPTKLKTDSLGLQLVERLTRQIHGSVVYINADGATVKIQFKDMLMRSEID